MRSGDCSGSTYTNETLCVVDPPSGYAGPTCLNGYCANATCTVCNYPE